MPFDSACGNNILTMEFRSSCRSKSTISSSVFPASILEMSRMSSINASSVLDEDCNMVTISFCSLVILVKLSISLMPTTPFNGVRIS